MAQVDSLAVDETFTSNVGPNNEPETFTVAAGCDTDRGRWFCVTHDESFTNNFQKDMHITTGKHRFVWICFDHGPERP